MLRPRVLALCIIVQSDAEKERHNTLAAEDESTPSLIPDVENLALVDESLAFVGLQRSGGGRGAKDLYGVVELDLSRLLLLLSTVSLGSSVEGWCQRHGIRVGWQSRDNNDCVVMGWGVGATQLWSGHCGSWNRRTVDRCWGRSGGLTLGGLLGRRRTQDHSLECRGDRSDFFMNFVDFLDFILFTVKRERERESPVSTQ